jgi:Tol biopolymer transport system component
VSADRTRLLYEHRVGVLSSSTITGRGERLLPTQGGWVENATFSPDGRKIVYETRSPGLACSHDAIHVMDAAGGNDHTILAGCGSFFAGWSPDSRQLAFGRYRSADDRSGRLVVANADGSNLRVLVAHTPGIADIQWSPSGDRIAYVAGYRPRMVHVIRTDGSHDLSISRGRAPTWAPDGRTLEYLWEPGYGRGDSVAVIARDGSHNHVLDPAAVDPYGQGVGWSPDSRTIAYRTEDPRPACSCDDIYLARPDGSDRRRLVHGSRHEGFGPLYWTRDGSILLYTRHVQHGE